MAGKTFDSEGCPVDFVLKQISGPWTTHILWLLRTHGILRFGELRRLLPDISPKMLTDRLKRLEADGAIDAGADIRILDRERLKRASE